ncbi:hypothetical protein PIB30_068424 [Stylosanthes scabra]|uniref:DUF4484 domain-containing protein n=1 Tax=Stylosanthes scabra TaxID=79078 RepID=A0ABU6TNT5_9FABA|nr:hypothetical protein [Stylosanthes scabra]
MVPRDQADDSDERSTCGIRLASLTWPKPSGLRRGKAFIHFLTLFMNIDSEEGENYLTYPLTKENVLPFVNSFTDPNPSIQAVLDEYWSTILTARLLPVGLPVELNVALKRKVVSYSPQFVARQFGLAQALPAPILPDTDDQLVHYEVNDLGKLEQLLDHNHERMEEQFNRQSFPQIVRCWLYTQSFATWWSKYFTTHTRHIGLTTDSREGYSFRVEEKEYSRRQCPFGWSVGSKETAEPEAVRGVPLVPATLSKIVARIITLLGFPLQDLATNDEIKSDLISAINVLDDELPVSEADLTHQFGDFISALYSSDLLILADRKKELDAVVDGWKLLCRRAVDCLEATSQISQVLEQGKKSEQEAVARIKALED